MRLYQLKMLVQERTNSYAYKLQEVQFWYSVFNWFSFIWSHRFIVSALSLTLEAYHWKLHHWKILEEYQNGYI